MKIKRKNIRQWGYSEREMAILGCHDFLVYSLQRRTMEMFQRQQLQLQLKFQSLIHMKLNWAILNN